MGKEKIQKQLNLFIKRVKKNYNPERIILFGSYARNKASVYSDVDILIVSESFKETNPYKRFSQLHDLGKDLEPDFNAIGITPEEIKKNMYLTTIKDALKTGVTLYSH